VVLSACETGRGAKVKGEGLVGLTRALQGAGARSVVATLWKIPDNSTAWLTLAFHRELAKGVAKDEALRRAMAITAGRAATGAPYFWASCVLTGDPDRPIGLAR
jgi:CHAT domain-containing protein